MTCERPLSDDLRAIASAARRHPLAALLAAVCAAALFASLMAASRARDEALMAAYSPVWESLGTGEVDG